MRGIFIIIFTLFLNIAIFSSEVNPKNLDLVDVPIGDLFAYLSKNSKYTILGDTNTNIQKVDAYFEKGMEIDEILYILESTYNLKREQRGNTIIYHKIKENNSKGNGKVVGKIIDSESGAGIKGVKVILKQDKVYERFSDENGNFIIDNIPIGIGLINIKSKVYKFKGRNIDIKKGENSCEIILSKDGEDGELENIGIEDEQNIKKCDIMENINLKNSNCEDIQRILKETFGSKLKVSISKRNNSVIIMGDGREINQAIQLISKLDKKEKQIKVTAEILDVKENLFEELGFTWNFNGKNSSGKKRGLTAGVLTKNALAGLGEVVGSGFGLVGKFNSGKDVLDINLNLLEGNQDLKTQALPSIILLNGEEGVFKMTEEVIVGENKDENDKTERVTYTPIFREAGIILKVTPIVNDNDYIYLNLSLEASDFKLKKSLDSDIENSGTYNSQGGAKVTRSLNTRIQIKNNETILIGGLKRKVEQNIENRVPYLHKVPVVGKLFKSRKKVLENTDLYIKLKAEIVE